MVLVSLVPSQRCGAALISPLALGLRLALDSNSHLLGGLPYFRLTPSE
jgi:hypothetical protein